MEVKGAGPGEARSEAFVDGFDLAGEAVGCDDDLFAALVKVVEDVKELLLGLFFADDKLEIVDNKAVELLEFSAEFFALAVSDGVDEVGVEVGDGGVKNFAIGIASHELVADGLNKVGFAEAGATIKEEWITTGTWCINNTVGGSDGDVVMGTDDETIDGVLGIEPVVF